MIALARPTGGAPGTTLTTWIEDLHTADVWSWPMQAFLCLTGLGITALSITGVIIWRRKSVARARVAAV